MFVRHMSNIGRTYILSFHLSVHRQRFSPLVWPRFSKIRYVMKNAVFTFLLIRTDAKLLNSDRWTKDTNLVMPGFLGTPAGMTTISAPTRESSSCSAPTNPTVSALDWMPVFISPYYDAQNERKPPPPSWSMIFRQFSGTDSAISHLQRSFSSRGPSDRNRGNLKQL